jgi:hypothetical protein
LIYSCRPEKSNDDQSNRNWSDNHSVDFNQEINEREQLQIRLFLEHNKSLKMKLTDSGLRYMIYKKNKSILFLINFKQIILLILISFYFK